MIDEEQCGSPGPAGQRCTMPKGHEGKMHGFEIEIPPDLGTLIAQHIDVMELRTAELDREIRRGKWIRWGMIAAGIVNIIAAVYAVLHTLS